MLITKFAELCTQEQLHGLIEFHCLIQNLEYKSHPTYDCELPEDISI